MKKDLLQFTNLSNKLIIFIFKWKLEDVTMLLSPLLIHLLIMSKKNGLTQ